MLRSKQFAFLLCIAATLLVAAGVKNRGRLSRPLVTWNVTRLGGKVRELRPVTFPNGASPAREMLPLLAVTIEPRCPRIPILKACQRYSQCLVHIGADNLKIDYDAAIAIGRIKSLNGLTLRNSQLTDGCLAIIGADAQLESVWIDNNPCDGSGFLKWHHPEATIYLEARSTNINDITIVNLLVFARLRKLALSNTEITDKSCAVLARLPELEQLLLDGTAVSDDGLIDLASSPSLSFVSLIRTNVTPEGIRRFKSMRFPVVVTDTDAY